MAILPMQTVTSLLTSLWQPAVTVLQTPRASLNNILPALSLLMQHLGIFWCVAGIFRDH